MHCSALQRVHCSHIDDLITSLLESDDRNDINIRSYLAAVVSTEQPAEQAPHDPVRARYFPRCTAGGGGGGGGTRLATPTRW